ncbi:hypothetical protein NKG94_37590 [Micromonospora sp. M12]
MPFVPLPFVVPPFVALPLAPFGADAEPEPPGLDSFPANAPPGGRPPASPRHPSQRWRWREHRRRGTAAGARRLGPVVLVVRSRHLPSALPARAVSVSSGGLTAALPTPP